jgi:lipoprotein-anchoring transpeptidase ErfK/SrfK
MMIRTEEQIKKLAKLTSVMLMATAEALAGDNQSKPQRKIVVSLADHKLAVVEAGRVVKVFSVAVGAPKSPSPTGTYEIVNRLSEPTYYGFGKVIPPGKSNPIGPRWIGLSARGYGIHGTNEPNSIGRNASHGCIRMRNNEVAELFEMVGVGDTVEILAEHTADLDPIFGAPKPPAAVTLAAVVTSTAVENR